MFKCTLGPDPSLRVILTKVPRTTSTTGSAFAAQTTCATYRQRIKVQNTHTFPIKDLLLRDAVPLPFAENQQQQPGVAAANQNNSNIKVVLKEPAGLSEARAGEAIEVKKKTGTKLGANSSAKVRWEGRTGDKDGKYQWVLCLGAGEEVEVESEYEVRAPSDFSWVLQEFADA